MRRFVHRAQPEPPPKVTLNACIALACNEANTRMRQAGRREWNDDDYAVSVKILCRAMRKLPDPYSEIAARMEADLNRSTSQESEAKPAQV